VEAAAFLATLPAFPIFPLFHCLPPIHHQSLPPGKHDGRNKQQQQKKYYIAADMKDCFNKVVFNAIT
jgi:hypothetical protein